MSHYTPSQQQNQQKQHDTAYLDSMITTDTAPSDISHWDGTTVPNTNNNSNNAYNSRKRNYGQEEEEPTQDEDDKKERKPRKAPHELLTDAEKKANHIASEKKRRQNIRLGFDQLIEIVPSLTQGNRSEAFILQKSVDHIRHLINVKNDLKSQIRDLQGVLGEPSYDEDSSEDDLTYSSY